MAMDILSQRPNHPFVIHNNKDAKTLLVNLGILSRFTEKPSDGIETQVVVINTHKTHHVLSLFCSGHDDVSDNGFVVVAFPKSRMNRQIFIETGTKMLSEHGVVATAEIFND